MSGTSNLYLIRHGDRYNWLDEEWSKKVVTCGGLANDSPLSPIGSQMARDTAVLLKDVKADCILASPYLRAIQTAVPIAEQKDMPIFVEDGLSEAHHIPDLLPDAMKRYIYFPHIDIQYQSLYIPTATDGHWHVEDAFRKPKERFPDGYMERMLRFSKVLEEYVAGKTVICVSHAASVILIAALLKCDLEKIPSDKNCEKNERTDLFAPVGVYHLKKQNGSSWQLVSNGSTNNHVTQSDPTTSVWGFGEGDRRLWKDHYIPLFLDSKI